MIKSNRVHVVDQDCGRRAKLARLLYQSGFHAEIYETFDELMQLSPAEGVVLINDDGSIDLKTQLDAMRIQARSLPIAMFSSRLSAKKIVQAMSSGALDYFAWPCSSEALVDTVDHVSEMGERKARAERRRAQALHLVRCLTPRESDVLKALLEGASNKEMAQEFGISPRTVEIHRGNMMARLDARSVADAVRIGLYAEVDQ